MTMALIIFASLSVGASLGYVLAGIMSAGKRSDESESESVAPISPHEAREEQKSS